MTSGNLVIHLNIDIFHKLAEQLTMNHHKSLHVFTRIDSKISKPNRIALYLAWLLVQNGLSG
jgi:hypothetical protein